MKRTDIPGFLDESAIETLFMTFLSEPTAISNICRLDKRRSVVAYHDISDAMLVERLVAITSNEDKVIGIATYVFSTEETAGGYVDLNDLPYDEDHLVLVDAPRTRLTSAEFIRGVFNNMTNNRSFMRLVI
jgi:hypothetical protein